MYPFSKLLDRVYNEIEGNKERAKVPLPKLGFLGGRKTIWANYTSTCEALNRNSEHIMKFISSELAVPCNIGGSGEMTLKSKFRQNKMESILKKYIIGYVQCRSCRTLKTGLEKENRITYIQCLSCRSKFSVETLK